MNGVAPGPLEFKLLPLKKLQHLSY